MYTDTFIKQQGMNALISSLGYVGAERFIMLVNKEHFDYTKWRELYLNDNLTVKELSKAAQEYSKKQQ